MSLMILAVLVVIGVGGVVLAIHLAGGTVTVVLESEKTAIDRFADDFPEAEIHRTIISSNRQTAILALGDGSAGVVHAIGDRFLTRHLSEVGPYVAQPEGDAILSLKLDDISWRGARIEFDSQSDRDAALGILKPAGENQHG
ncbi:MAG: hypothetical protein AB3N20_16255 [Rhizobiaceae bacterium]